MKKFFQYFLFLAFFAMFLFPFGVSASHQFSDAGNTHAFHEVIGYLKEKNVVGGYSDGTFRPDAPIKRVEVLRMLIDAAQISLPSVSASETAGFSDAVAGQWYIKYVKLAKQRGIVAGYQDGTFRPVNTMKLGEALKVLFLTNSISVPELSSGAMTMLPADVVGSDWFAKYVDLALQKGIIVRDAQGKVQPGLDLSRAKFAELAFRLRFIQDQNLSTFAEKDWAIYESQKLFNKLKAEGRDMSVGPCLSNRVIPGWVMDVAHFPRQAVDDAPGNQCSDYVNFRVDNFVELDQDGSVIVYGIGEQLVQVKDESGGMMESGMMQGPETVTVNIEDFLFNSSSVTIRKGDTVRFVNNGSSSHQIATDPHPTHTQLPAFQSTTLASGGTYEFTFTDAGTFTYHCHIHPSMRGAVVVTE